MFNNKKPIIQNNCLVSPGMNPEVTMPIQVGTPAWYDWLAGNQCFIYQGNSGHLTARREFRRGTGYWYGYRRLNGKLSKLYLGRSQELASERLENACRQLSGQKSPQLPEGHSETSVNGLPLLLTNGFAPTEVLQGTASTPLTKIRPPALPQKLISRQHLFTRIDTPVTIIAAPSGFGKTTLLNEWRQSKEGQVAWVSLDADDNDPLRFWSIVIAALQTVNPVICRDWLTLQTRPLSTSLPELIHDLSNDILKATESGGCMPWVSLVLDNYHLVQNAEIHSSIQHLLDHLPPSLRIIISSQTRPPFGLGNLRARGLVTELGPDDLRFKMEEGIAFIGQRTNDMQLSDSEKQALVKRTEGWVAGLVLATSILSQQEQRSKVLEIFTGAHTFLREFFMESVLHQQPQDIRDFLLKTSILKQLNGGVCDAVTGRHDSDQLLLRLWEENLFLERLEEPGWYRYHEMLAEMLRNQLQEQYPAEISRLYRKAARWYRTRNLPSEVINHLLLGQAWEEAASLIEDVALNELEQLGEDSRLLRWIQKLPEKVIQQHKTLLTIYVRLAKLALPSSEVDDFLSRMEKNISSVPKSERSGNLQETLMEIQRIRRFWVTGSQTEFGLQTEGELDAVNQMLDGILRFHREYRIDLVKAERQANEIYQRALARNHLYSILKAGGECAILAFSQGHLVRTEQIANKVLQQAMEKRDTLPETAGIALTALSNVAFERNQLSRAQQLLDRAFQVNPDPINPDENIAMSILRAKIQSTLGDTDAAAATIQTIRELNLRRPSNLWQDQDLIAYQALFQAKSGDFTTMEGLRSEGWEIDQYPFPAFIQASLLMEQNRNVLAEDILRRLIERYPSSFYWVPILRARIQLSMALFNQNRLNQARQVMTEAVRIAAPEFFARPFVSSNPTSAALLSLVRQTEPLNVRTHSFITEVLRMLDQGEGLQNPVPLVKTQELSIAASISPREQEILQSLSVGMSNREIAEEYYISSSTVKTHLENIFRKLNVGNRTQAIAQAQALGLIQKLTKRA